MPKTKLGKWSVRLIVAFLILMGIFSVFVASGQEGGETFSDNLLLAVPGLSAAAAAIAAFFTGVIAIVKDKERAITVFLSTLVGAFVLFFVAGEILFPH